MADLVLYDGVCGLCNHLIQFILRRDHADRFRFASLQSALAADLLRRNGREARDLDTVYLVRDHDTPGEALLAKSRAIFAILDRLGGPWVLARVWRLLPWSVLDFAYDQIARRRYRWFGRYDACPLPTPGARAKFLDGSG